MPTTKIDLKNDPVLTDIVARRSASVFEEKYANLLACYSVGDVFSAIASIFRIDGRPTGDNFTVPNVVAATEDAFKKLLIRGALNEFQVVPAPLPSAALIELDLLFGQEETDVVAEARAAKVSERQALIEEAKRDWRTLDSRDCKRKWTNTPEKLAILEEAWAQLEAQDKAVSDGYRSQREQREREANQAMSSKPLSTRDF